MGRCGVDGTRQEWLLIPFFFLLLEMTLNGESSGAGRRDVADLSSTVSPEPIAGRAVATPTALPKSSAAGLGLGISYL